MIYYSIIYYGILYGECIPHQCVVCCLAGVRPREVRGPEPLSERLQNFKCMALRYITHGASLERSGVDEIACYAVLYYTILYYTIPYYTILYHTIYHTTLHVLLRSAL